MGTVEAENIEYIVSLKKVGSVAKGSILSNDGVGTFEEVAPPSDGKVIESDSSASSGSNGEKKVGW